MSALRFSPAGRLGAFLRRDEGGISVEAVLWIPVYLLLGALIADVSMVMNGQARAMRIVQDTNRLAASGFLDDASEIRDEVVDRLTHISANADVTASITGNEVRTTAVIPASDLEVFGAFLSFSGIEVTVSSVHLLEG